MIVLVDLTVDSEALSFHFLLQTYDAGIYDTQKEHICVITS